MIDGKNDCKNTLSDNNESKRTGILNKQIAIKIRTIIAFLTGVLLTLIIVFVVNNISSNGQFTEVNKDFEYETVLDLTQYIGDIDSSWTIIAENPSISEIRFESGHGYNGRNMILHFHEVGANDFTFISPSGETSICTIDIDEEKRISVYKH